MNPASVVECRLVGCDSCDLSERGGGLEGGGGREGDTLLASRSTDDTSLGGGDLRLTVDGWYFILK